MYGRGSRDPDLLARINEMRQEQQSLGLWIPCFEMVLDRDEEAIELD